jgi:CheY-like chemotaxis protein
MAKIVFCEDEGFLQKLIHHIMRSTKHEVYIASDGLEGLALIERTHPDLILTDISMPDYDGFQLADTVKARPHLYASSEILRNRYNLLLLGIKLHVPSSRVIPQVQRGSI